MRQDIEVHLAHCNQGEYEGSCKYGEDDTCPALAGGNDDAIEALDNFLSWVHECDENLYDIPKWNKTIRTALEQAQEAQIRAKRLYEELINERRKFETLRERLDFNPDWLQCGEDVKKLFQEIRAEYHEVFESQQITIQKWGKKYRELKGQAQEDRKAVRDLAKALRNIKVYDCCGEGGSVCGTIEIVNSLSCEALTTHTEAIKRSEER